MSRSLQNTLSSIAVGDCMRSRINRLSRTSTISSAIGTLIKYKIGGLLVMDEDQPPAGVVSKTNIVAAYYAFMPLDSPLEHIMTSPPLFCKTGDPLAKALETMKDNQVYRLFVKDSADGAVVGALAYPDIVGMLYEFCSTCEHSLLNRKYDVADHAIERLRIGDCMTRGVKSVAAVETLSQVLENLARHHLGAILVTDESGRGAGVISKTDLILAYNHGVPLDTTAAEIMTVPVRFCREDDMLEGAIREMILSDVHRLFVRASNSDDVLGVFSLTDAARNRSGSCLACISSRIEVAPHR